MQNAYTVSMAKNKEPRRPEHISMPVRMPADLKKRVDAASEAIPLSQQDVLRLSIDRGLDILLTQLGKKKVEPQPAVA